MKIYLINPKFPVTYWGFEHSADLSGVRYTTPPLAIATVAGLTPDDVTVEICDENVESIDFNHSCDLVGLTAYLVQGPRAFEIAAEFRRRGKRVVLGGPMTTLSPEICAGKVDVLFIGEVEYTWPQFLKDFKSGNYRPEYTQREKIDMHDSPAPRMDLLKLDRYAHAAIQTTRGCPYGCEFCDIIVLFGRVVRCKDVSQVINEMKAIVPYKVDSIFFTDDNFIGNRKYVKELLRAIIEFNKATIIPMHYLTQVSIDCAKDDELLELLHEAHFDRVFIGIETPRKDSLKEAHKGQNVRADLVADIHKIQSFNIDVSAGMIVGFDHDDVSIFQEQLTFIMESNVSWAMTGMLQAIPQTPLFERLKRENRIDTSTEAVTNTSLEVNIVPKNMTKEELVSGYLWLSKQLYSYENYAKRVIGNLKAYSKQSKIKMHFPSFLQLQIIVKTIRYYFLSWNWKRWKFSFSILSYVLLHKPGALYDAMVHLVSFKHLHFYVYNCLDEAFRHKAIVFEQSMMQRKQSMTLTYNELRGHAALVSQKICAAYEELKSQLSVLGHQAASEYEEVRRRIASLNQQTIHSYDELRNQVQDLSQRALAECDTLRHWAAFTVSKQTVSAEYEELRKQLAALNTYITESYEEFRKQVVVLSEKAAFAT